MVFCKRQVGLCMCVIITSIRPDLLVNFCMTSKHEHTRLSLMSKHACSKAQKQCCAECCPSADGNVSDTHTGQLLHTCFKGGAFIWFSVLSCGPYCLCCYFMVFLCLEKERREVFMPTDPTVCSALEEIPHTTKITLEQTEKPAFQACLDGKKHPSTPL